MQRLRLVLEWSCVRMGFDVDAVTSQNEAGGYIDVVSRSRLAAPSLRRQCGELHCIKPGHAFGSFKQQSIVLHG